MNKKFAAYFESVLMVVALFAFAYFAGFSEIYDLREKIKDEEGSDFDLKQFHETFLSFGSAPIKEIKKLML